VTAITILVDGPELRQQFGEQGHEMVRQNFTQGVLINEFEDTIRIAK